jgi:N-acetylglutamate synthase-like GNAT family acetyltransferase
VNGRRTPIPTALPLAVWERDGLAAALARAGLPADDIQSDGPMFWRFENEDVPVGFGGLQIFGDQALLRSVVTLPPVRKRGIGSAIVTALETEARALHCRVIWAVTETGASFFTQLGYRACERDEAPDVIRTTGEFARPRAGSGTCLTKRLG